MRNLITTICLTIAVLLGSVGVSESSDIPKNAYVYGNSWFCKDGYKRSGDRCFRLNVPENAYVYGNSWFCKDGYKRSGNGCLKMTVAEYQAQINTLRTLGGGGASYTYDVSGYGSGEYVSGSIDASSGSRDVDGYITLDDGREVYFEGEWVGKGEIEGYDEDGNYYELEVD